MRGVCVEDAGGYACVVADNVDEAPIEMGSQGAPLMAISSAMITLADYNTILSYAQAGQMKITVPVAATPAGQDINFLSSFSSRGPTADGRFKPDVCSVGQAVMSVKSDGTTSTPTANQCPVSGGILSMSGTSMATPVTSGTAALVRQYFEEGWHWSGVPNATGGIKPSSTLVKVSIGSINVSLPSLPLSPSLLSQVPEFVDL
jgi:subtilisin family serine protease